MEKPISINGLILIQEKYFQQPQIRLKHTLALAGRSPLVIDDDDINMAPEIKCQKDMGKDTRSVSHLKDCLTERR
eukprot:scaffold54757_cov60-Cyclotella_meneghiniana.AAC.5